MRPNQDGSSVALMNPLDVVILNARHGPLKGRSAMLIWYAEHLNPGCCIYDQCRWLVGLHPSFLLVSAV